MAKFNYRSKYKSLIEAGFLPEEARELKTRSKHALTAPPYMKRLIASRRMTLRNAMRYGWTMTEYRQYIRDKYANIKDGIYNGHPTYPDGALNVWAMVREYERSSRDRGDEYESPWKSDIRGKSVAKKKHKRVTRKDMLESQIKKKRQLIARTASDTKRQALEDEVFGYEQQLRQLS